MAEDFGLKAGQDALEKLAATLDRLEQYLRWCDRAYAGEFKDSGVEVRKRLCQLQLFMREILVRLAEAADNHARTRYPWDAMGTPGEQQARKDFEDLMRSPEGQRLQGRYGEIATEMEAFTAAFYWTAWRARCAIKALPGLEDFEAEGLRDVRNQLLEHPDKLDSGVLSTSFGYGGSIGPVIKVLRQDSDAHPSRDAGLFVNATEFATILTRALERALLKEATSQRRPTTAFPNAPSK